MTPNYIPFQGGQGSNDSTYGPAGGFLLPPEQGEILVNGVLVETGAIQLAGDARSTSSRKTQFPIWLGQPDADFVDEGQSKPLTGAALGQGTLDIKKLASIIVFTDEMLEDLQNGDLNVLADAGVRQAIAKKVDQHAVGLAAGAASKFNTTFVGNVGGASVTIGSDTVAGVDDRLQKAVSAAMGVLEGNGYGDPTQMGVLLGFGWQQILRDARQTDGRPIYDGGTFAGQAIDPLYSLDRAHSTNLVKAGTTQIGGATAFAAPNLTLASTAGVYVGAPVTDGTNTAYVKVVTDATHVKLGDSAGNDYAGAMAFATTKILTPQAVVLHKPNLHVRLRQDINVRVSNEATLPIPTNGPPGTEGSGTAQVSMFVNNLTAVRYEMRLGFFIHDVARAVVPIWG
jgi:hypothetical protein